MISHSSFLSIIGLLVIGIYHLHGYISMTSSLFLLPMFALSCPGATTLQMWSDPWGVFSPCGRDFPWQADSLQLLSCAPASKPKSNLKKDNILRAAGCRGFSVTVRIMWQWHSGNGNQKPCNVFTMPFRKTPNSEGCLWSKGGCDGSPWRRSVSALKSFSIYSQQQNNLPSF